MPYTSRLLLTLTNYLSSNFIIIITITITTINNSNNNNITTSTIAIYRFLKLLINY